MTQYFLSITRSYATHQDVHEYEQSIPKKRVPALQKHSHCLLTSYQVSWGPEIRAERRQIPFSQTHTHTPQYKKTHTTTQANTHTHAKTHTHTNTHTKLVHLKKQVYNLTKHYWGPSILSLSPPPLICFYIHLSRSCCCNFLHLDASFISADCPWTQISNLFQLFPAKSDQLQHT